MHLEIVPKSFDEHRGLERVNYVLRCLDTVTSTMAFLLRVTALQNWPRLLFFFYSVWKILLIYESPNSVEAWIYYEKSLNLLSFLVH